MNSGKEEGNYCYDTEVFVVAALERQIFVERSAQSTMNVVPAQAEGLGSGVYIDVYIFVYTHLHVLIYIYRYIYI